MNRVLLFLFISVVSISCHSLVEDHFQDVDKTPVLNALIQADSIIKVHVTFPERLDSYSPHPIHDAVVVISSSENWTDTLSYEADGWYYSSYNGCEGVSYNCTLSINGYDSVTAHTSLPFSTSINNIVFTEHAGLTEEGLLISSIQFTIQNKREEDLFWELYFREKYEANDFWDEGWNISEIYMIAGQDNVLLNEAFPLTVFSNKFMDDEYTVAFYFSENYVDVKNLNDFYIELRTVDESYYKYQKQKFLYDTAEDTGLGSSVQTYPLYSNVVNGKGIFTSFSVVSEIFNYSNYQE